MFIKIFVLCLVTKQVNAEARDKTNKSRSGKFTFGLLKQLRNSIKSGLSISGSSYFDILGGQGKGSLSFTFPTNLLAQCFIKVLSVISMQEIAVSTYELQLRLS